MHCQWTASGGNFESGDDLTSPKFRRFCFFPMLSVVAVFPDFLLWWRTRHGLMSQILTGISTMDASGVWHEGSSLNFWCRAGFWRDMGSAFDFSDFDGRFENDRGRVFHIVLFRAKHTKCYKTTDSNTIRNRSIIKGFPWEGLFSSHIHCYFHRNFWLGRSSGRNSSVKQGLRRGWLFTKYEEGTCRVRRTTSTFWLYKRLILGQEYQECWQILDLPNIGGIDVHLGVWAYFSMQARHMAKEASQA